MKQQAWGSAGPWRRARSLAPKARRSRNATAFARGSPKCRAAWWRKVKSRVSWVWRGAEIYFILKYFRIFPLSLNMFVSFLCFFNCWTRFLICLLVSVKNGATDLRWNSDETQTDETLVFGECSTQNTLRWNSNPMKLRWNSDETRGGQFYSSFFVFSILFA